VNDLGIVSYDSKSLDGESGLKKAKVPKDILNNAVFGSAENIKNIKGQILFTRDAYSNTYKE
jgi:hypothetical protein